MLLLILQERNNGEKPPADAERDPKVGNREERKGSSSQETQKYGNQSQTMGKRKVDHLEGEFKKVKPTNFDGESTTGEEVEAWMLDIKKYFQIYNYSNNVKVRMQIYNLKGNASIQWQDLKSSHGLKDNNMEWSEYKKLFKKQYLIEIYYERKTKKFYELKLGHMTMEYLINKFLDLLRFVSYIKYVKVKIQ